MTRDRVAIIGSAEGWLDSLLSSDEHPRLTVARLSRFDDALFLSEYPDLALIILSGLSQDDALRAVSAIRRDTRIPIVFIGPECSTEFRVGLLEAGADDCICGTADVRERRARVAALLRRTMATADEKATDKAPELKFRGLTLETGRRRILLDGKTIELTTAEFDLLLLLVNSSPKPLSRAQILDELRGVEWETVDRSIDILVSRLRDKLRDNPRRPRFIRTVRNIGYQFVGEPTGRTPIQQSF